MEVAAPDVVGDLARAVRLEQLEAAVANVVAACACAMFVLALAAAASVTLDKMTSGDDFQVLQRAR